MNIEPVELTTEAIKEVKNIIANKGIPKDYALRIGIKGGGCGAMGYVIGFDKSDKEDINYSCDEVSIIINKKHVMYLIGLKVDFEDTADSRGFSFNKPEDQQVAQ